MEEGFIGPPNICIAQVSVEGRISDHNFVRIIGGKPDENSSIRFYGGGVEDTWLL